MTTMISAGSSPRRCAMAVTTMAPTTTRISSIPRLSRHRRPTAALTGSPTPGQSAREKVAGCRTSIRRCGVKSMARRLYRRSVVTGEITLPAAPGMIDEYVTMCDTLFAGVGRRFSAEELAHVRTVLEGQLAEAFATSPRSTIVISYNAPIGMTLNYNVKAQWWTVEGAYENWISTREPPLFGPEPDARVWALANEAAILRCTACSISAREPGATRWPWPAAATRSTWWK